MIKGLGVLKYAILALGLALAASVALAEEEPMTPATLKGAKVIDATEAAAVADKGDAAIFDMRKALNFEKGHLKGAVSMPYDQKSDKTEKFDSAKDKYDLSALPKDKAKAVMFYSDGPTGWKSYKMAAIAVKEGYKKVLWFRGGTAEWTQKGFKLD